MNLWMASYKIQVNEVQSHLSIASSILDIFPVTCDLLSHVLQYMCIILGWSPAKVTCMTSTFALQHGQYSHLINVTTTVLYVGQSAHYCTVPLYSTLE